MSVFVWKLESQHVLIPEGAKYVMEAREKNYEITERHYILLKGGESLQYFRLMCRGILPINPFIYVYICTSTYVYVCKILRMYAFIKHRKLFISIPTIYPEDWIK